MLEQKRARIEAKHKQDLLALEMEYKVLKAVPLVEGYHCMVLPCGLFGSQGLIKYRPWHVMKTPDQELLRSLLTEFPPVAMIKVKGSCTSFQPQVREELLTGSEITEVEPVIVDISTFGPIAEFKWYADLWGELWRFGIEFPLRNCRLGDVQKIITRCVPNTDRPAAWVWRFQQEPGLGARSIAWATGEGEKPSGAHFTLYGLRDEADIRGMERFWGLVKGEGE